MKTITIIPFLIFFALTVTCYSNSPNTVHERRDLPTIGWSRRDSLDKNSFTRFRLALKQSNLDQLEYHLMDVAHPDSPNYSQGWTPERVRDTFAPSDETISAVTEWLLEYGIPKEHLKLSEDKGWLHVKMTIHTAELLFETKYHQYQHEETGTNQMACDSYSLPSEVLDHIEFVLPGITLIPGKQQKRSLPQGPKPRVQSHVRLDLFDAAVDGFPADSLENCGNQITPACIKALYNFHYDIKYSRPNALGISEFTPVGLQHSDLDLFFRNFSPSLVGKRPNFHSIDGGLSQAPNATFENNGEADLDFEYAMTLVGSQYIELYQVGDTNQSGSSNNLLDALDGSYCTFEGGDDPDIDGTYPDPGGFNEPASCGTVQPAEVISTSYGAAEASLSQKYLDRQCFEFGKLGLGGHTILFSSGDSGVASPEGCIDEKTGQLSPNGTRFAPLSPASCPFVTAVGATQLSPGSSVYDPETAAFFTGGGFSNHYPRPAYQDRAVSGYLRHFTPNDTRGHFNENGRGIPDIGVNGLNYTTVIDGVFGKVSGTSASAPSFAALITAINDARGKLGKKPVGFINPAIYSTSFQDAFNDITTGNNAGCGTNGFIASKGWDPLTGLGTPNFPKLLERWLNLP